METNDKTKDALRLLLGREPGDIETQYVQLSVVHDTIYSELVNTSSDVSVMALHNKLNEIDDYLSETKLAILATK